MGGKQRGTFSKQLYHNSFRGKMVFFLGLNSAQHNVVPSLLGLLGIGLLLIRQNGRLWELDQIMNPEKHDQSTYILIHKSQES